MIEILGYIGALFIGLILGLTGGGGSILTVPVLVYIMGFNPVMAAAYSLLRHSVRLLTSKKEL